MAEQPDFSLYLDILRTLEKLNAPYVVIGAFAGTSYGVTRVTADVDIVVDLSETHIEALAAAVHHRASMLTRTRCGTRFVWVSCSTSLTPPPGARWT